MTDVDVLVAGGGPAGCAAAAALARAGFTVLLADAGQDRRKQLAGELLHPVGLEDLASFGFEGLHALPGARIVGFAVIDGPETALLPYAPGNRGLGIEHHTLIEPIFQQLAARGDVAVRTRTRVTAIHDGTDHIAATLVPVKEKDARGERVRARVLVVADGRGSPLRRALGITDSHERLSTMVGVRVPRHVLPHPDRGHLFVGGPAPVLAYAIGPDTARVMVDLPLGSQPSRIQAEPDILRGIPEPLRGAILGALDREAPLVASNDTRHVDAVVKGRAVLVGDAAGCCHPLSASGMASGIRDARELQRALSAHPEDVPRALAAYARARRPPNRTRIALASALYEAFSSDAPEMAALRKGLFRYWEKAKGGARISMSLLSTRETRMSVMAREYARVVTHGLTALGAGSVRGVRSAKDVVRASSRLVASALPHLRTAMAGAVEDRLLALPAQLGQPLEPLAPSRASASRS